MTVESYKKWKEGKPINKAKIVIDFYKTNPTIEQEALRSKQIYHTAIINVMLGVMVGLGIGLIIGAGI